MSQVFLTKAALCSGVLMILSLKMKKRKMKLLRTYRDQNNKYTFFQAVLLLG